MREETFFTAYDSETDTLYILGKQILPNTLGMTFSQHFKAYDEAWAMSYEERVEKFATPTAKKIIKEQIAKHKGCNFGMVDRI